MAVDYKEYKPDQAGKYGPTDKLDYYYKANPIHNPDANGVKYKSRWNKNESEQFCVFNDAVNHDRLVDGKGYLGIDVDDKLKPLELGLNGEVIAVFHVVANPGDPWHGNPDKCSRLDSSFDEIIKKMRDNKELSKPYAMRMIKGVI